MDDGDLAAGVLDGDQRSLARAITRIENREAGYRDLAATLYRHAGDARVVGVTGSPGAGKSTLVDRLVAAYREQGHEVGVVAVDPASPFTGGSVLGDRVRMGAARGDPGVFVRSMSARGTGGLSAATADAVAAMDAYGADRILVETVGAGQSEVEVVRTADSVVVLVPPGSGDDVQMLKAGILEIADVFVVNKADLAGADRTVTELRRMVEETETDGWRPPVVETVATEGEGVAGLLDALADHHASLGDAGGRARRRHAATIRAVLRDEAAALAAGELDAAGGAESFAARVADGETDPYAVVDDLLGPVVECLDERRQP